MHMKQQTDSKILLWAILIGILYLLILVASIVKICNPCSKTITWPIVSALATFAATYISFAKGLVAHNKQLTKLNEQAEQLDKQTDVLNLIYEIVSKDESVLPDSVLKTKGKCNAYVQVALYAMYQSFVKRPIDYKIIDPERPEIVKFIIVTIISTLKSSDLICTFGDDDTLLVSSFNQQAFQVITDGQKLVKAYSHFKTGQMVKDSIHRINVACGISEKYTA